MTNSAASLPVRRLQRFCWAAFISVLISRINRVIDRSQFIHGIPENEPSRFLLKADLPRLKRGAALLNRQAALGDSPCAPKSFGWKLTEHFTKVSCEVSEISEAALEGDYGDGGALIRLQ